MSLPKFDLSELKLLVVDDCKFMRLVMVEILNALNCRNILTAVDGADALEALQQSLPDIIITDWLMPHLDGIELTRMLRAKTHTPEEMIPIIMLTAHTESFRVAEARDAGVTELLSKPISAKSLYSRLVAVIDQPRPFVRAPNYTGPCRHRHNSEDHVGPKLRSNDEPSEAATSTEKMK